MKLNQLYIVDHPTDKTIQIGFPNGRKSPKLNYKTAGVLALCLAEKFKLIPTPKRIIDSKEINPDDFKVLGKDRK